MSGGGARTASQSDGPSLQTRICALAVVIVLAALAAYTMFSGPTKVAVKGPSSEQSRVAPPVEEPGSENDGASRGD